MPGMCPTWAKWVGQAHLLCSFPRAAFVSEQAAQPWLYFSESFMAAPGRHALEGTPKCLAHVCTAPDHTGPAPGALAGK